MVRGDKFGQYQDLALEKGFAYHFSHVPDLSKANSPEAIVELLREEHPEGKENQLANWARQLFATSHRIKKGDLVAMPLRKKPQIAIGRVTESYEYRTDLGEVNHIIPVEWLKQDIPRTAFKQDFLYSFGAFMTVCQIQRNNAEARVREILKGKEDPGGNDDEIIPGGGGNGETEQPPDIEQMARDQIMSHIQQNFKGHDLSRLIDAVLQAEGYITKISAPGPDGGVDILAARGVLGFELPRLCVQVKSSQAAADVTILRALQGTMQNFKADQGLLVSWGGFNKAAENEARMSFFSVRLWNAIDVVEAVFKNYDRLPKELQSELPLKRIWALVIEE